MDELFAKYKRYSKLELASMATLLIAIFASNFWMIIVAWNLWFILFVSKGLWIDRPLNKKFGEIKGCFHTLRLLGLLKDEPPSGKKESKESLLARLKQTWGKIKWQPKLQPQLSTIKYGDL